MGQPAGIGEDLPDHLAAISRLALSLHSTRSNAMRLLSTQRSWLVVERLPAFAPELNPVEGLWSSLKAVELANLTGPTLAEVINQAHQGVKRVRRTPQLAYSFLRHAGLSVS
jgi:transposase